MDTDTGAILTQLVLDRNGVIPLYVQLRSALEMAIISGTIADGAPLPSVRRLAEALAVAPITVLQAYRDLQEECLVRSIPKRGYFVTIGSIDEVSDTAYEEVYQRIDAAFDAARAAGLDVASFLHLVAERARRRRQTRRIAVIGRRDAALAERVTVVAAAVADLSVEVIGLSYEELGTYGALDGATLALEDVHSFLVPVGEIQHATVGLGPHAHRVLPMNRTLRADVRDFIRDQPAGTRFGIIAGSKEKSYVGRILATLRSLRPLAVRPVTATIDNRAAVDTVIQLADVVLVGSTAAGEVRNHLAIPKPWREFIYVPDDRTLDRLRILLTKPGP
jgi:GntR family transcriptional regulator